MRRVHISITSSTPTPIDAEIRIERRRDERAAFSVHESIAVSSGLPEADREFLLGDNERIVIEARGHAEIVYDRAQGAAVSKTSREQNEAYTVSDKTAYEAQHAREREIRSQGGSPEMAAEAERAEAKIQEEREKALQELRRRELAKAGVMPVVPPPGTTAPSGLGGKPEPTVAPGVISRPPLPSVGEQGHSQATSGKPMTSPPSTPQRPGPVPPTTPRPPQTAQPQQAAGFAGFTPPGVQSASKTPSTPAAETQGAASSKDVKEN